jgi:hypothetical protein
VYQADWPEIFDLSGMIRLLQQDQQRPIEVGETPSIPCPESVDCCHYITFYHFPSHLIELANKSIRPRCLIFGQLYYNLPHFFFREYILNVAEITRRQPDEVKV